MSAEAGRFATFYFSPLQHPLLMWAVALAALVGVFARRDLDPSLRRYCLALGALSLLDAWLTSRPVPGLGTLPEALSSGVPLLFVLAGDFRYLLLWFAATPAGGLAVRPQRLAAAAGVTLIVPLFTQLAAAALPAQTDPRAQYLIYEVAFFALSAALLVWHPRARKVPWIRPVSRFVMLYYGLWAGADILLLATGADIGYALRVIPNLLYYGGLIAAIAWIAPAQAT